MEYQLVKWLHILSAIILFGTGLGSAFYKWRADKSGNRHVIVHTNKVVVMADWIFTTPTVIFQPLSGIWLAKSLGYTLTEPWLLMTYVLYFIAGSCWIPVVWLQIRMRDISLQAVQRNAEAGEIYQRLCSIWFWLGIPAFVAMTAVIFLMVFKPVFFT